MAGSYSAKPEPTITSRRESSLPQTAPERFWIPLRPTLHAADGGARPNSGGTPFRQPCPAYPSTIGRKAPQERFSEENLRTCSVRKRISLSLSPCCRSSVHTITQRNRQHTASLDVLAERNYYSKSLQTSSTRLFASHWHRDWNARRTMVGRMVGRMVA